MIANLHCNYCAGFEFGESGGEFCRYIVNLPEGPQRRAGFVDNGWCILPPFKRFFPRCQQRIRDFHHLRIRTNMRRFRAPFRIMKADIHPEYLETDIVCACGAVYHTRSTRQDIKIGICAACHPFFTGEQKFVDTAGRVEKFARRYGSTKAARGSKA